MMQILYCNLVGNSVTLHNYILSVCTGRKRWGALLVRRNRRG